MPVSLIPEDYSDEMTLIEKQHQFPRLLAKLLDIAWFRGYEVTLGETWRSPETAKLYEEQGKGIQNSLHCLRLAIDINLFKNGQYLTETNDYRWLGENWTVMSYNGLECCWGGYFSNPDGNHFSVAHAGIK